METKEIPFFTIEKVREFRALQDRTHVSRTQDGDYEPVNYSPGSSVRFWVNIESRQYDLHWHASTEIIVPIVNTITVRLRGMEYGANVVMPNLSPTGVRDKYMLYDGKICTGDEAAECRRCMELRMEKIGYHVAISRGDSLVKDI